MPYLQGVIEAVLGKVTQVHPAFLLLEGWVARSWEQRSSQTAEVWWVGCPYAAYNGVGTMAFLPAVAVPDSLVHRLAFFLLVFQFYAKTQTPAFSWKHFSCNPGLYKTVHCSPKKGDNIVPLSDFRYLCFILGGTNYAKRDFFFFLIFT